MNTTLITKYIVISIITLGFFATLFYARAEIAKNKSNVPTPTPIPSFPVDKLELQNVEYDGKTLTGLVLNKGDKAAFNTKLSLKISKDRSAWSIEEQHDFTVPYKIDPNQSVKFSESFKTTKINPWTATAIVEAKYYNGENIPTPTSTPTLKPKVYVNPDPIIPCTMSKECGGDIRQVKKSECTNGTCCQIGSTWIFYPSRDKCTQDQKAAQPIIQQAPVQQPAQTTSKLNYYCYDNTYKNSYYTSSGEECNRNNASSVCRNLAKSSLYDPCMGKCLDTAYENNRICIWGYFGANAAIENNPDLYQECTDEAGKEHQQCMDTCSSPYQEALKKCY